MANRDFKTSVYPDEELLDEIRRRGALERRSISAEILWCVERYYAEHPDQQLAFTGVRDPAPEPIVPVEPRTPWDDLAIETSPAPPRVDAGPRMLPCVHRVAPTDRCKVCDPEPVAA